MILFQRKLVQNYWIRLKLVIGIIIASTLVKWIGEVIKVRLVKLYVLLKSTTDLEINVLEISQSNYDEVGFF